jgi:hypothetical protein
LVAVCKDWPFCQDPQQPPDIPRVMEIAKKFGLEILPPPGARMLNLFTQLDVRAFSS